MYRAAIFDLGRVLVNLDFARGSGHGTAVPVRAEEIPSSWQAPPGGGLQTGCRPRGLRGPACAVFRLRNRVPPLLRIWSFDLHRDAVSREPAANGWPAAYRLLMLSNTMRSTSQWIARRIRWCGISTTTSVRTKWRHEAAAGDFRARHRARGVPRKSASTRRYRGVRREARKAGIERVQSTRPGRSRGIAGGAACL